MAGARPLGCGFGAASRLAPPFAALLTCIFLPLHRQVLYGSVYANGFGVGPAAQAAAAARSAQGAGAVGPSPVESPSGTSEACQAGVGTQHLLQPLGLAIDAASFPPVSPRRCGPRVAGGTAMPARQCVKC